MCTSRIWTIDSTNRLKAAALAETLLDSSPDGLMLVGDDGVISLANRSAGRIFGYPVEELVGMSVEALVPSEHRGRHATHRDSFAAHPARRPMGTDLRLLAEFSDGSLFPAEISLSPVTIDEELCTIATVRDVTERQEALAHMALLQDRERIARDLHDMVIQRLFAAGMTLQVTGGMVESLGAQQRISAVVDELDDTIRELRNAIFQLGNADPRPSLSGYLAALVHERALPLGFTPKLRLVGDLDSLADYVGDQIVATLTEALSNVARHADATRAHIEIIRTSDGVTMTVDDDGVGISASPKPKGGLSNMMWRAAELGGSCKVEPSDASGTRLVWRVPS